MSDILVESPSRYTMMILVTGLFIAFGAGFVVGSALHPTLQIQAPQPVAASTTFPANYSTAQHDQEVLQDCYKFMGEQLLALREDVRASCQHEEVSKPITH
jgi:hypothetical protein